MATLLFFHILGAVGLITGIALEVLIVVRANRAADVAQLRAATLNAPLIPPVMGGSTLLLLGMGIWMIYAGGFGWGNGWIDVVLAVVVAFAVLAPVLVGRTLEKLHGMSVSADGPITSEMDTLRRNGACNYMVFLGLFETIAALYVMTAKPALPEVIAILVSAAIVAAAPTALVLRRASVTVFETSEVEEPATLG